MTTVLITGATGFVGSALVKQLVLRQYKVVTAVRAHLSQSGIVCHVVREIGPNTNWVEALGGVDVVIHLAARVHVLKDRSANPSAEYFKVNVQGTEQLAKQAMKAGVKRFIFLSTAKVNGEFTHLNQPFMESSPANPQDAYAQSKYQAEQVLFNLAKNSNMDIVVIRSPLIYGFGVKANFASLLIAIKRGIPLPLAAVHNQRSLLFVGNLVHFIHLCMEHPAAANAVFFVSDGNDISTPALIKCCAKALGVKARLFPVSTKWLNGMARLFGKKLWVQRLCENLQVDTAKARHTLDWQPPYSMEEGLKTTVQIFNEIKT